MTTTSPGLISPALMAAQAASSESNTRAGPVCVSMDGSTADFFTMAPSGAMLPCSTLSAPCAENGSSCGRTTSPSAPVQAACI